MQKRDELIMPSPRSVSSQTETVLTDRNCSCRPKLSPQTETHVHKLSGAENGASCPFRVTGCWLRFPLPLGLCLHRPKLSSQTETHVHKLSGAENFLGLHSPSGSLVGGPGFPFPSVCVLTDRNCPHRPKPMSTN